MNQPTSRLVYFVSDGTGITAETLGRSLLAQFEELTFEEITVPFIDTIEKAAQLVKEINAQRAEWEHRPIIIDTIVDRTIRHEISRADAYMLDVFETFVDKLQAELCVQPVNLVGKSHSIANNDSYNVRIEAVNFALDNDDGARTRHYDKADLILVGVSRSGKTPTSLYMALQFGVFVANYPLTEDDFDDLRLPASLREHKHKLFGLTIDPDRLSSIRNERRANSTYASLSQCQKEVRAAEAMFNCENVPFLRTTHASIEEISTRIMAQVGLRRHAV